jgi:MFS family permease
MISLLSNPSFRLLFSAQVIALIGTGLSTVALSLLAYDLAAQSAGVVLGTALAIKMVAYIGVSTIVGAFAHRLPRKPLLACLDLLRAGIVFCLPFVDALWQIYLLIFLLSACSAGFKTVFQVVIPDLLQTEKEYTRALSLSRLAYDLENLLSPALAALALTLFSYNVLFTVNSVAFLFSSLLVVSAVIPAASASDRPKSIFFNLGFGISSYLATPRLRGLLLLCAATAFASSFVIVNSVVYVRDYLGGTDRDTALVFAASGAGSMLAALALPRLLAKLDERRLMISGGIFSGVAILAAVLRPELIGLCLLWFVVGFGGSLIQTPAGRLVYQSCRSADRSAFFSAQFALSHACWLAAYPLAGWLGTVAGLRPALSVFAALVLGATLAAARAWPIKEMKEMSHLHEQTEHDHPHIHDEHHRHRHDQDEPVHSKSHSHPHSHPQDQHSHPFVIDQHHRNWP